ncbi:molybdopterin-dependent oxidoreductase [Hypericibacter adhaerens]|uniref:molybdopterin-dependent oxidoreductase n=1 Tax=Hypericibacter adhaerens TaxID=2602016 RepID=UPI001CD9B5F0|nr:molybdopterin-dependent oxidoreductase [Hypericibacter adhaerens]
MVLTIRGNVAQTNAADGARLDMAMLESLPQQELTVHTPWYPQPVTLTGPLLRDVLSLVGATGQELKASAIDDYTVEIPISDTQDYDVIVATKMNGKPMAVRDNGPLFVMYPLDSNPALRTKLILDRCIWQLNAIVVE